MPVDGGLTPSAFVHVAPDGLVTIACARSEMGQGVRSSLPALIADELGADPAHVAIVQADGDEAYGNQDTDGSSSVRGEAYGDLRRLGATARVMLVAAAAAHWNVRPSECEAHDHRVLHPPSKRQLGFGELASRAAKLPLPAPADVRRFFKSRERSDDDAANAAYAASVVRPQVPDMEEIGKATKRRGHP